MVIFPLAPDQTIAQMWSNGARGHQQISQRGLKEYNQYNRPLSCRWRWKSSRAEETSSTYAQFSEYATMINKLHNWLPIDWEATFIGHRWNSRTPYAWGTCDAEQGKISKIYL